MRYSIAHNDIRYTFSFRNRKHVLDSFLLPTIVYNTENSKRLVAPAYKPEEDDQWAPYWRKTLQFLWFRYSVSFQLEDRTGAFPT